MSKTTRDFKTEEESEFGDFQTPAGLAIDSCRVLLQSGIQPKSIVEPTCGLGGFLFTSLAAFPATQSGIALDISPLYISAVKAKLQGCDRNRVQVIEGDFFQTDWTPLLAKLPEPILIIGNPPWVTNAQIGALGGCNLPKKSNFQNHSGLDAITGKSNFDISEWMLIQVLEWLNGRTGCMAMLCKTAVARKLLGHAWSNNLSVIGSAIYRINALKHFGAAVDACLFVCRFAPAQFNYDCAVYDGLEEPSPKTMIGYHDGQLVADAVLYERRKHLQGQQRYKWRSGIKHDCSRVMELTRVRDGYQNGFGQVVYLEDTYLYPMLKTSEVANSNAAPTRFMLVPQRCVNECTDQIERHAPATWEYLQAHSRFLAARGSSIYTNRPAFSIFGVGDYSFAEWKVAISGFYKKLEFRIVGPYNGRPVVLDDSSYFVVCRDEAEAHLTFDLLNSIPAQEFFRSFVFWDAKRPITVDLLSRIDLVAVARVLGRDAELTPYLESTPGVSARRHRRMNVGAQQLSRQLPLGVDVPRHVRI